MFGPDGLDFNAVLRNSQERVAKAKEVRERMVGLTGHAETPDGRIKVASTSADPLAELHIDPRAMRMGSESWPPLSGRRRSGPARISTGRPMR